jgi:hypothetical protein
MRLALVALLLAGCQPDPKDFDRLPGGGGGIGGGGGGGGDADAPGDALLNPIDGRVCLTTDLRQLNECSDTAAGNLTVTIGGNVATTIDDGSFTIERPEGTGLTWRIEDPRIVTSLAALGVVHQIPAIRANDYNELLLDNGFLLSPGQGAVVTEAIDNTFPVEGVVVSSNPASLNATRYDGANAAIWDLDATGDFGVAWIPDLPVGPAIVTADPPVGSNVSSTIAIEEGAITFVKFGF